MKIFVKFDYDRICNSFLKYKLDHLKIDYKMNSFGEVEIVGPVEPTIKRKIQSSLNSDGIEIVNDQNLIITQKIKELIVQLIMSNEKEGKINLSNYLEEHLPFSYIYLSKTFSETTYMSIEKFAILKKIDYVKELLMEKNLSLSEIAYRLNYSSVSHLSTQFKKTTGFSPSYFLNLKKQLEIRD